jgi:lipoprotein-anchoring transpeptidase ErfK/SrfK
VKFSLVGGLFGLLAFSAPAAAQLAISINTQTQSMDVAIDGVPTYQWPVSTGAAGYSTPGGSYRPFRLEATHYSKEWDDAPMPYSIFFTDRGHAIHATNSVSRLGTPASHGCVRLAPENAAILFKLVKEQGLQATTIDIQSDWNFFGASRGADEPAVFRQIMDAIGG